MVQLLADVFCVLALCGQDLAAPDYVRWDRLEHLKDQTGRTLAGLLGQMAVVALGHWLLVLAFYLNFPDLYLECFRKVWHSKMVLLYCCGFMIHYSIFFWPKCMMCNYPTSCLVYLECSATGQFMHDGYNVCDYESKGLTWPNESTIVSVLSGKIPGLSEELLNCKSDLVSC